MKILAIDTATEQVSIAVGDALNIAAAMHVASDRRHVEALIPAIRLLLGNLGLTVHDLSAIAVDVMGGLAGSKALPAGRPGEQQEGWAAPWSCRP